MTTNYCPECVINWAPFMCAKGCCPECGGGTARSQEPISDDAQERHHKALQARIARERSEHNHRLFEEYYAAREAARQPTDEIDTLEVKAALPPAVDPERWNEAA